LESNYTGKTNISFLKKGTGLDPKYKEYRSKKGREGKVSVF
jgi:hypothetical protein